MRLLYFLAGLTAVLPFVLGVGIGTFSAVDGEMSASQTAFVIALSIGASLAGPAVWWAARKGSACWAR